MGQKMIVMTKKRVTLSHFSLFNKGLRGIGIVTAITITSVLPLLCVTPLKRHLAISAFFLSQKMMIISVGLRCR